MKILLSKYKIFLSIYLIFFVFISFICFYITDYQVTTTGDITDISSYISVSNDASNEGSFNSIFVYSVDNVSLFQKWIGSMDSDALVYKENENYTTFSNNELTYMGEIQKNQSKEASIINAYKMASLIDDSIYLDYHVEGLIVHYLVNDNNQFKLGDIITSINNVRATDEGFYAEYKNMMIGSHVNVIRDNKEIEFVLNEYSANYIQNDKTYSKISVYYKYYINYETIFPRLTIEKTSTLGPSAGLLQSLCIYNKLIKEDITKGLKIAGTGMIYESGSVGAIGGIKQKIITAYKNKCDVFICPKANEKEGLEQYNKLKNKNRMKFIICNTFQEALEGLYEITV